MEAGKKEKRAFSLKTIEFSPIINDLWSNVRGIPRHLLEIPVWIFLIFLHLTIVIPAYFLFLITHLLLKKVYGILLKLKKANEKLRNEVNRLSGEIKKTFKK